MNHKRPVVALAGNPNSGKTSLFNALTGARYKVANYPGVTVEKREGQLKLPSGKQAVLIDLPGIYSIFGTSLDEQISTKVLLGQAKGVANPDLVVVVVDATNLERNLYLVSQLVDLGHKLVIALSMLDLAEAGGIKIRKEILASKLGVPVIPVVAPKKTGTEQLLQEIESGILSLRAPLNSSKCFVWMSEAPQLQESALELGAALFPQSTPEFQIMEGLAHITGNSTSREFQPLIVEKQAKLREAGIEPESCEATLRYRWINAVVKACCSFELTRRGSLARRIDWVSTHRIWGVVFFLALMAFIFQSIFLWASLPMELIDSSVAAFGNWIGALLPEGTFKSLIVDGIIAGVGSVIIFVPQIALLFFFIGLLEDSGYLARAAFVTDKLMRKVGLQGRSFIPLLSSFACAIPGIMATRSIPGFADRFATILIAPLMSCSARLPVYSLLIAAFIPAYTYLGFISLQGLVLLGMYLLGVLGAVLVASLLKASLLRGQPAFFVMEMPPFRRPSLRIVLRSVWDRVLGFIKNAGTIILACSIVLWFLASYPQGDSRESYAKQIGHFMQPLISPLGYNWEIGVGILASFAAREVFVSSLATVYNVSDDEASSQSVLSELEKRRNAGTFTLATALSLMVFYVFACQCMSTLAVCRRETGSWSWTGFMFLYMTLMAYIASFFTYQAAKALL